MAIVAQLRRAGASAFDRIKEAILSDGDARTDEDDDQSVIPPNPTLAA